MLMGGAAAVCREIHYAGNVRYLDEDAAMAPLEGGWPVYLQGRNVLRLDLRVGGMRKG